MPESGASLAERVQPLVQAVFSGISVQLVQEIDHRDEIDAGGVLKGGHAQGDRQVHLPDSRWAQKVYSLRGMRQPMVPRVPKYYPVRILFSI